MQVTEEPGFILLEGKVKLDLRQVCTRRPPIPRGYQAHSIGW